MHSHILPGLDDGAGDWDQSLAMARVAVADGVAEMVCTPHWVLGKYENSSEAVLARLREFKERLVAAGIPLVVHAGTELRIDMSLPERIHKGELLTINDGRRYVLLELPEETLPGTLEEFFWKLQIMGYRPILSHVERNHSLREDPRRLFNWVESGILMQLTAASLLEELSEEMRDYSFLLLEHRLIHMLVSDSHGLRIRMRPPGLSRARQVIEEKFGPETAARLVFSNPQLILRGESIPVLDPIPLEGSRKKKKSFWSFLTRSDIS